MFALIEANPNAFILLYVIAHRARWNDAGFNPHGLAVGEALVGDFERYGMSEREYRTAKKCLEKWKIATFKPTTLGSVARLIDTPFFSVSDFANDGQNDRQETDSRQASDRQATTKEERGEGIEREESPPLPAARAGEDDDFPTPEEYELLTGSRRVRDVMPLESDFEWPTVDRVIAHGQGADAPIPEDFCRYFHWECLSWLLYQDLFQPWRENLVEQWAKQGESWRQGKHDGARRYAEAHG